MDTERERALLAAAHAATFKPDYMTNDKLEAATRGHGALVIPAFAAANSLAEDIFCTIGAPEMHLMNMTVVDASAPHLPLDTVIGKAVGEARQGGAEPANAALIVATLAYFSGSCARAGVPLTLVVEPEAARQESALAGVLWPALALCLVAGLAMAWLWRRFRGPAPPASGSPRRAVPDDPDVEEGGDDLDDSVIAIMRAVGRIATSRDLTIRVPVTEDVTGAISDALNLLTEETGRAFREVGAVSGDVARATIAVREEGQRAADASRAELREVDLAAQELAAAARALTGVAELARRVDRSAALAVAANAAAAAGVERTGEGVARARDLIRDTEKLVKRLGERSQEIGQVVALIRSISERTGILALNASIHAAAHREQGRGFGSVADEVKRLDLGTLVLTPFEGMTLQLQVNKETNKVQSLLVGDGQSALEVGVFAGPAHGND